MARWPLDWRARRYDVRNHSAVESSRRRISNATLVATHNGTVLLDAEQRIGADPEDGQVKCWTHDVEGGHSEGIWSRQATSWIVESRGVTADGEDLRGTSVYTPEAENQIYWQSLNNWRGGRPLLDFDVTLSRSTEN